ncbi:Uncharacterized protein TPAR_02065 [Tolypocladium paradoxum]|uniref:chitinase n=1 Tax=Tolypocladium paradoxum TaxID=94208 RepID=A0A2S4L5Q7_9HYPO|nr:Uncharacterized protein TPAR_02065 [Tolypocladium paradoxum]
MLHAEPLDGVDFDWKYPGAPDLPDIPPGSADEGNNYLAFLTLLKGKLPGSTSVSVALPASYWYLRQYPVKKMADIVDYFVYMSYDLHGQWDVGNKWAVSGCDGGNCLRSHVNKTETENSLAMITKAGVKSNKLMVGVSSYGRSFRMADASCRGPMCKYTGTRLHSDAYKGPCTDTGGYISNAELKDIIMNPDSYETVDSYYDENSDSNILVYGNGKEGTDWVAFMACAVKTDRVDWIKGLNFAGTADWAIDLEDFQGGGDGDKGGKYDPICYPSLNPGNLKDLVAKTDSIPAPCWNQFAMDILDTTLDQALKDYAEAANGYEDKFGYYVDWVKDGINPRLKEYMNLDNGKGNKYFNCEWTVGLSSDSSPCPPTSRFWEQDEGYDLRYELKDEDGFYKAIAADLGIDKSWIKFGTLDAGTSCQGTDLRLPGGGQRPCQKLFHKRHGFPLKGDNVEVANPMKLVQAAMANITELQKSMLVGYAEMALNIYGAGDDRFESGEGIDEGDAVIAAAMPVFMLQEAVESMKVIKDIGAKAAEEAKKRPILMILNIVLMVIPFVGEVAGPLFGGAVMITRIATLIADAGNVALGIAEIIDDPLSAPFVVLAILAGGGAGGSGRKPQSQSFRDAAAARRGMKGDQLALFSQAFREKDELIQKLTKACVANVHLHLLPLTKQTTDTNVSRRLARRPNRGARGRSRQGGASRKFAHIRSSAEGHKTESYGKEVSVEIQAYDDRWLRIHLGASRVHHAGSAVASYQTGIRRAFWRVHSYRPASPIFEPPPTRPDIDDWSLRRPCQPCPKHKVRFWGIFASLCCLSYISSLDVAIISTALPTITAEIGGARQYLWIANSFVVASGVLQPLFGQLLDIFGRRIPLMLAVALVALGSALRGAARNVAMMMAGRVIQGAGAGGMYVRASGHCCNLVSLRERGKYLGLMLSRSGVAAAIGPLVGGELAEANWRWVFYLNIPFCGLALGCQLLFMSFRTGAVHGDVRHGTMTARARKKLD